MKNKDNRPYIGTGIVNGFHFGYRNAKEFRYWVINLSKKYPKDKIVLNFGHKFFFQIIDPKESSIQLTNGQGKNLNNFNSWNLLEAEVVVLNKHIIHIIVTNAHS